MTDPSGPAVIEVSGLSKWYRHGLLQHRRRLALDGLTFRVERGEIFGYLGPNGSGKTTTLKILVGLLRPTSGSALVLGRPYDEPSWRTRAGFLPEQPYFYDYLTAEEYLDYAARLCGVPPARRRARAAELLRLVGLWSARAAPLRRHSKGMLQRLGLAQALVNDPEVLFLDEPMSGLDPVGRRMVRDIIGGLKGAGKTVLFSTHILPDAESLCDRVAVLKGGRLLSVGRLDEILRIDVSHVELLVTGIPAGTAHLWPDGVVAQALGERWRLTAPQDQPLAPLIAGIEAQGGRLLALQPVRRSLEDFFFEEMSDKERVDPWTFQD